MQGTAHALCTQHHQRGGQTTQISPLAWPLDLPLPSPLVRNHSPSPSKQGNLLLVFTPLCCNGDPPDKAFSEFLVWPLTNYCWLRNAKDPGREQTLWHPTSTEKLVPEAPRSPRKGTVAPHWVPLSLEPTREFGLPYVGWGYGQLQESGWRSSLGDCPSLWWCCVQVVLLLLLVLFFGFFVLFIYFFALSSSEVLVWSVRFLIFLVFSCACGIWKFLGQGSNLWHNSDSSCCSYNPSS